MSLQELGNLGEVIAAIATLATLIYLALQIKQNTARKKMDASVSIQQGQNNVIALAKQQRILLLNLLKQHMSQALALFHCLAGKDRTTVVDAYANLYLKKIMYYFFNLPHSPAFDNIFEFFLNR